MGVRPFHSAWFMKRHEPGPPLLFTMIMKVMVIPRTTSSESKRCIGDVGLIGLAVAAGFGTVTGFAMWNRISEEPFALTLRAEGAVRQEPSAQEEARTLHGPGFLWMKLVLVLIVQRTMVNEIVVV